MFCKFCGKEIDDDVKFCPACGGIITNEDTPVVEEPVPVFNPYLEEKLENCAKKSLIFGILSLAFGSIIGFIFALIGKGQAKSYASLNCGVLDGKAKIGNILSTIGIPYGILSFIWAITQIVNIINTISSFF